MERRLVIFICMKISLYPFLRHPGLMNLRSIRRYPWGTIWIERYGTDLIEIPVILTDYGQNTSQDDVERSWWDHLQIIGEFQRHMDSEVVALACQVAKSSTPHRHHRLSY